MFCSFLEMENYQGDLTDIVRGGAGDFSYGCSTGASLDFSTSGGLLWPQLHADDSMKFGDPFSSSQDPLLISGSTVGTGGFRGGGGSAAAAAERPCNVFSRVLPISPGAPPCESPAVGNSSSSTTVKASAAAAGGENLMNNGNCSTAVCLVDNSGMQISSPRNPAVKRRKSQVKKVVCIPAPAPANRRPSSGEVVPSDLWAWRKYGQKPIKGSPYPRGYYRCSSSKGCPARKQVERSRTDPNMLVITYTSDHNHPWPTHRNALAGSTRTAHPSKSTSDHKTTPKHHSAAACTSAVKDELDAGEPFPYSDDFFSDFAEQMNHESLSSYLLYSQSLAGDGAAAEDPLLAQRYDWPENDVGKGGG